MREGGTAGVAGNDGRSRASSEISGSVSASLELTFSIRFRTSYVTKIDVCFF